MTGEPSGGSGFVRVDDGDGEVLASREENAVAYVHTDEEGRRTVGYLAGDGDEVDEAFVVGPKRGAVTERMEGEPDAWAPEALDDPTAVMAPEFDLEAATETLAVVEDGTVGVRRDEETLVAGPNVDAVADRLETEPTAWSADELDDPLALAEPGASLFGFDEVESAVYTSREPETGVETAGYLRERSVGDPQSFVLGPDVAGMTDRMGVDEAMHWAPSYVDDVAVVMADGLGLEMMEDLDASDHADALLFPGDPDADDEGITEVQREFAREVGFGPGEVGSLPDGGYTAGGPVEGVWTVGAGDFLGNHHVEFRSPPAADRADLPGAGEADSVSADLRLGDEVVSYVGWNAAPFVAACHDAEGVEPARIRGSGADDADRMARLYGEEMPALLDRPGSELSGADADSELVERLKREAAAHRDDGAADGEEHDTDSRMQ